MKDLTRMKICTETGTNMGKLQPVRCGCGGNAHHDSASCWNPEQEEWMPNFWHRVICKNCGTQTKAFYTEAEAIQAWNTAMGDFPKNNIQKIDTVIPVKCEYGDKKTVFASGYICPNCYTHVAQLDKYCSECGMKLDWNNYV